MGQALFNRKVGEVVPFEIGGKTRNLRIDSITVA